jgi:putative membrane protein
VLLATPGIVDWGRGWIWLKLALVGVLTVVQMLLARWRKSFAAGIAPYSERFFRMINELPTLAMIAIVVLVVIKPF